MLSGVSMEIKAHECGLGHKSCNNATSMTCLGSQLRNMPIPSPPSLPSSSEDESDDLSDDDDSTPLECFLPGSASDLTARLLITEEDVGHDLSNLTLVGPETQARLEALLEAAGVAADGRAFTDPEVLRRLTSSVSSALDEAAAALTRMRTQAGSTGQSSISDQGTRSLVEACIEGDIAAVRKLLEEGRSVHEPTDEGESLLSLACSAGYYELVQVLLAMNANVEDRGSKGDCTPLMEAASGGFVEIVRLLVQHGANVNAQSSSGNTALHYACCSGYDQVVEVLIKHLAYLEHQNENGHTPLMEAASCGKVKVAQLLLDAGAGINTHSSEFKESALTLACYKGNVEMVEFLLERGADQEHKTDEMHTALMEASMDGHVEVARLLLDHGAQVNMPADSFESPLTLAACGSHVELAQLLIEHGANLEEVNDEGYTPLMEAAREGYLPMVALLLEHGANINAQTEETQETALTLACCGGFQEVVGYLLDCGANIELGASTPLMEAATEGHVDLVRFLLEKGANVNAVTASGDSALTYAAENGKTVVAGVLIEHGASLEHESEGGRTPLMKAARAGHLCTVEFLISKGANVNRTTTGDEHSVLSLACAGGHAAVVELLLGRCADPGVKLKDNSSMLIEAAKGGHTAVACLLIDTPVHQHSFLAPDSPARAAAYPASPVSSAAARNHSSYHHCQHMPPPTEHVHRAHHASHECQRQCSHAPPPPQRQQSCFAHNSAFMPPVQPSAYSPNFQDLPSPAFDGNMFLNDVDVGGMPSTGLLPQAMPSSVATQVSLAHLTPADFQSLAQALTYTHQEHKQLLQRRQLHGQQLVTETPGSVTESVALSSNVTFTAIDPRIESLTTQSEVCTPSPSDTTTAVVTSAGRTIASTGVQTEDAISMIQKLTNSVHQWNALQSFAAAHNLDLVNLGEIAIPPGPFPLSVDSEDDDAIAESVRSLEETLRSGIREEPIGQSCPLPISEPKLVPTPTQSPTTPPALPAIDIDQATESNHDTALTIAAAGGHDELIQLLLARSADIEHRDKKGCTPLILAATAGKATTCQILLDHGADIEAQSDRTKDTALSLACSSGRQEVVELLLMYNANYEHRNVSDYTPLSLAASGGYVGIIKVLLNHGAEINSRTGSKLGISPLMLAAMNGHVAAVKLLLDMGSDVNAQIETNRNTALTLACFQGRTEVVSLLLDRKANVEHRAKTGLTPLMEAASGGYVEVGRVLIDRGADVNAPPVPSSRDTALTIAADKGHYKFVELLVVVGAAVEVKNKKGCTPMWLAANGGHLDVVQFLANEYADMNCTDNRGVSCLMAAFRKGHIKVVKWLVRVVSQFPSDTDMKRFMQTVTDKELLKKLEEGMQIILSAKMRQEAEANKNASILLEQLDHERKKEERRRAAAQKKRDKKKQKKKRKTTCSPAAYNGDVSDHPGDHVDDCQDDNDEPDDDDVSMGAAKFSMTLSEEHVPIRIMSDERPDLSTAELKLRTQKQLKDKKKEKKTRLKGRNASLEKRDSTDTESHKSDMDILTNVVITTAIQAVTTIRPTETVSTTVVAEITKAVASSIMSVAAKSEKGNLSLDAEVAATMATAAAQCAIVSLATNSLTNVLNMTNNNAPYMLAMGGTSPKKRRGAEEGWKEVTKRSKKIVIPAALISRVIGRGGCNVNAIREYTSAHIDIDTNRKKANGDCMVTIKGTQCGTRQASALIEAMIEDPDRDVSEILPTRGARGGVVSSKNASTLPPTVGQVRVTQSATGRHASAPTLTSSTISTTSVVGIKPIMRLLSSPAAPTKSSVVNVTTSTVSQMTVAATQLRDSSSWVGVSVASAGKASQQSKPQNRGVPTLRQPGQPPPQLSPPILSNGPDLPPCSSASQVRSVAPRRLATTTVTSSVVSSLPVKPLPGPIGSNRPGKQALDNRESLPLSSTSVSGSITATLHSTLTSLLSQVATQRSPMIWHPGSSLDAAQRKSSLDNSAVSSSASSPTSGVPIPRVDYFGVPQGSALSQGSSAGSSFKGHSRTPSLSPTQSNQSESPTPEEKPHLNPIGSERLSAIGSERVIKRSAANPLGQVSGLPGLLQASENSSASLWSFDYQLPDRASGWTAPTKPTMSWVPTAPPIPGMANGDLTHDFEIGAEETLASLLERLSLSEHLNLFQKNEIDLDALMLMSEQDYADIGLPKEPRLKLLKCMRRNRGGQRSTLNGSPSSQLMGNPHQPHRAPVEVMAQPHVPLLSAQELTNVMLHSHLASHSQRQIWGGSAPVVNGLPDQHVFARDMRPPHHANVQSARMTFNPPPLMTNWRPWSSQVDQ